MIGRVVRKSKSSIATAVVICGLVLTAMDCSSLMARTCSSIGRRTGSPVITFAPCLVIDTELSGSAHSAKASANTRTGRFLNYSAVDGLAGNRVTAIHEDEEGALWFATREGLSRFKDGRFFSYSNESGLLVRFVYTILDDDHGNFWFSCAQGLFRVSKNELRDLAAGRIKQVTSVDYGVSDGMKTRACNVGDQPTAWRAVDGTLLFCSLKGVVIVDPRRLYSSTLIPPVEIEKVVINKQEQLSSSAPQVPLGAGEVEIHYAALSYTAPEKVRFSYKLEGFDKEWVDAGTRRFAYYANLPPGSYTFKVIAGHIDGPWNETGPVVWLLLKTAFLSDTSFYDPDHRRRIVARWILIPAANDGVEGPLHGSAGRAKPDRRRDPRHAGAESGGYCPAA